MQFRVGDLRVRGLEGCQGHAESAGDGGEGVAGLDHIGWSGRRGAARNRDDLSGKMRFGSAICGFAPTRAARVTPNRLAMAPRGVPGADNTILPSLLLARRSGSRVPSRWEAPVSGIAALSSQCDVDF